MYAPRQHTVSETHPVVRILENNLFSHDRGNVAGHIFCGESGILV